jgi:methylmalonyl-CoA mutase N-terminal domain/subunit
MDETLALPTEKAAKIALRTQQVIAEETEATHVTDPLGGSYFVEAQTNRLEAEAERYFAEIDRRGGVVPATETGYIQREIHRSALAYQLAVERGEKKIVGVNTYVEALDAEPEIEIHRIDAAIEREQCRRLAELRAKRDQKAVRRELDAIRDACRGKDNLIERFVAAAHADCTLGEIADALRAEFGHYEEPKIL